MPTSTLLYDTLRVVSRNVTLLFLSAFAIGASCQSASGAGEAKQPNIVLIVADDLGYGELGCQGNPEIPTPNIDALADSGVRCTQAFVTAPNCSPSRAGLLTGRTPTRFGYEFNPIGPRNEDPQTGLPTSETTLAEALQAVGYTTGLIGKWHLGGAADYHPHRHGFDRFFGFIHEGHYFAPAPWAELSTMLRRKRLPIGSNGRHEAANNLVYTSHMGHDEPDYDANNPITRDGQPVVERAYLTDALSREAVQFIEQYRHTPFFLALTYNAVHSPLQAKQKTLEQLSNIEDLHRRIFAAMLVDLDAGVGRVLRALEEQGLREHTLVIFLSDNGGPTKELTSSNLPLRDGKGSMYEGGLRVPFLVSYPGVLPTSTVSDEIVSSLDIFPTCAQLAGAELTERLEGRDLVPILSGKQTEAAERTLFWRQGGRAALRKGDWKIVAPGRDRKSRIWELYHIPTDISEENNLAEKEPARLTELQQLWNRLNQQMREPLF